MNESNGGLDVKKKQYVGKMNKKWAYAALGIFVTVATAIVLVHALVLGYGLLPDMTISRYVGLGYWSAGLFLLANIAMAFAWVKYALEVVSEWRMSRLWKVMALAAALMLIMLSVFPMGLYDATPNEWGLASRLHRFSSYSMFVLMLLSDMGLMLRIKVTGFRVYSAAYLLAGVIMALSAGIGCEWFWGNTLVLESLFLLGYLVMFCLIPYREKGDTKSLDVI